jgi:hypothetical protein
MTERPEVGLRRGSYGFKFHPSYEKLDEHGLGTNAQIG